MNLGKEKRQKDSEEEVKQPTRRQGRREKKQYKAKNVYVERQRMRNFFSHKEMKKKRETRETKEKS